LLALLIFLRPDLGLALIAFSLSFFQRPVQLIAGSFSPVELTLALTALGFSLQFLIHSINLKIQNLSGLDWAAIFMTGLAVAATFTAENFGVSMREWRVVVFESG
jgi:hypothetical protein